MFEFYYDFRFSVRETANWLALFISRVKVQSGSEKIDIVAHSMGGLIVKQYLLNDIRNAAAIREIIFVATPHLGAPQALKALRYGDNLSVAIIDKCKLKRAVHNLPSMFNLLPSRRYFEINAGGYFDDEKDIDADGVRGLLNFDEMIYNLKKGKESRCLLKPEIDSAPFDRLSDVLVDNDVIKFQADQDRWKKPDAVTVFSIVGFGTPTLVSLAENKQGVLLKYSTEGDGTVPLWSAEWLDADHTFYVDLKKLKANHSKMIGDRKIDQLILSLLQQNVGPSTSGISSKRPNRDQFEQKTKIDR